MEHPWQGIGGVPILSAWDRPQWCDNFAMSEIMYGEV